MSRYCLDTSAYSQFKRGDAQVVELIDRAEWIGVPATTLGELWSGFLQGSRSAKNSAELGAFLDHPSVDVVPIDDAVARIYAEIVVALGAAGRPVPTNDIWVAAAAARAGAPVLTYDPHFAAIARVGTVLLQARS